MLCLTEMAAQHSSTLIRATERLAHCLADYVEVTGTLAELIVSEGSAASAVRYKTTIVASVWPECREQ